MLTFLLEVEDRPTCSRGSVKGIKDIPQARALDI